MFEDNITDDIRHKTALAYFEECVEIRNMRKGLIQHRLDTDQTLTADDLSNLMEAEILVHDASRALREVVAEIILEQAESESKTPFYKKIFKK